MTGRAKVRLCDQEIEIVSFDGMTGMALVGSMIRVNEEMQKAAMVYLAKGGNLLECQIHKYPDRIELVKVLAKIPT